MERVAAERIGRETVTYVSNIYKYYCRISSGRAPTSMRRREGFQRSQCFVKTVDQWQLEEGGRVLTIYRTATTPKGDSEQRFVYVNTLAKP